MRHLQRLTASRTTRLGPFAFKSEGIDELCSALSQVPIWTPRASLTRLSVGSNLALTPLLASIYRWVHDGVSSSALAGAALDSLTSLTMTFATLKALHSVIGDALAQMERVYAERSQGTAPLDYPSLDVPYYNNTASHNAEAEAAEKLASDPAVVAAANQIVAACGQLAASVHRPFFSLVEGLMSVSVPPPVPPTHQRLTAGGASTHTGTHRRVLAIP